MAITVYSVSGAPRAWRVLLGLTFKGIDHEVITLQLSKNEHKSPEYLKIHPRGTVPAMKAKDLILKDSIAMLAWMDREYPDPPIFGKTPHEAANIWQIVLESCEYLRDAANDVLFPLLLQNKSVKKISEQERLTLNVSAQKLRKECHGLENLLEGNLYLSGDRPSAADAVCFPEICLIERAIETKFYDMEILGLTSMPIEFPRLQAWKKRMLGLEGVYQTIPSDWSIRM